MLFRSDRKSTRLNSSHTIISYAVFCLKKKKKDVHGRPGRLADLTAFGCHTRAVSLPGVAARHRAAHVLGARVTPRLVVFFFLSDAAPPDFPLFPPPPPFRP